MMEPNTVVAANVDVHAACDVPSWPCIISTRPHSLEAFDVTGEKKSKTIQVGT
jgi:hypothetical protein